ncbi:MAG: Type 1 glutamine amidotransferase-like domain-containing protein [Oscillospiraceae bacterium]|nr:Type 1 glutamine amidotransferase-like domain-containing protein [Oscillospiraceae bacterium]
MKLLLTSSGLETDTILRTFVSLLEKPCKEIRALFIPTAAIDADSIEVLPKCMHDLLRCGIPKENIDVFDLHEGMNLASLTRYDAVYLTGGRTAYLLSRLRDTGFAETLLAYLENGGVVLGVSAGSLIFAENLENNLGLLPTDLRVHCAQDNPRGKLSLPLPAQFDLGNHSAILMRSREDMELISDIE